LKLGAFFSFGGVVAGPGRFNVVNIFIYLLIAGGIYFSFQYTPIFWKKMELESIVKDESYGAARRAPEATRQAIIDRALRELSITLDPDDVVVNRVADRVQITVIWRVTVEHPLINKSTTHALKTRQETTFY
jgi:hypothetical protein